MRGGRRKEENIVSKTPKYFMYFPGNYRWSAAFVNMLGRGAYGGADISELHKIGSAFDAVRFHTESPCPALTSRAAMASPMRPSPIQPMS